MRKSYLLFILAMVMGLGLQAQELRGSQADAVIPGAEHIWLKSYNQLPAYVRFDAQHTIPRNQFDGFVKEMMTWDRSTDGWTYMRQERDQLGHQHERFQQTYKGLPVEGSMVIIHSKANQVYAMNGDFYKLNDVPTTAQLSEEEALQQALIHIGANAYKWQIPQEEDRLQDIMAGNAAFAGPYTYFPLGELVIVAKDGEFRGGQFRLAWKFDIYAHAPHGRTHTYVDAINGEILWDHNRIHTVDVQGTAVTRYSGTRAITMDSTGAMSFRLRSNNRGNGVYTWDMNEGMTTGNAVDFVDTDKLWNPTANLDDAAGDAHWGAEKTYDYFYTKFGRNSIDDNGFRLNSYVHYGQNFANAFWTTGNNSGMYYGDGNNRPFTALDIAGHEITHGLTSFTANLIYQNESGALNESFSDVFGKAIENWARPNDFDWRLGVDLGFVIRNMANPFQEGDPRNYLGTNWYSGSDDNGGVHTNSGVQNYWYYLMVEGGSGTNDFGDAYTVNGQGFDTASAVAFRNLTVYLTPSSQYEDARFYAIQSAVDLYGPCSRTHINVANAWYAVGVGPAFSLIPVSDFGASTTATCSQPYEIRFFDNTVSAATYKWDFGDGNSSTLANPIHNYANPGMYNVKLAVTGVCGGADSVTKNNYITVVPAPAAPTVSNDNIMCGEQPLLVANGSNDIFWYDNAGVLVATGDSFYAPVPSANITYFAVNGIVPPSTFGGPANNNFGTGGIFANDDWALIFDVHQNSILESVKVYADGSGLRTIEYRDQNGNVLDSKTVDIPDGQSRVNLGFNLVQGTNYELGISGDVELYRNNANASYPYAIGNFASITGNNAPNATGYYYFFYDWEIKEGEGCISAQVPAQISVSPLPLPNAQDITRCGPGAVTFVNSDPNFTYNWYDGGGSYISSGRIFTTPSLSTTTTYFVEREVPTSIQYVGPTDPNFVGSGGYHNSAFVARLLFTVYKDVRLNSVFVDASSAGDRDIILEDGNGNPIQTLTINIPAGQNRIDLNLTLSPGDYRIGGSAMDLFRNDAGAQYPYEIANLVSITGSNANTANDFYYYLYDWEVQEVPCVSGQTTVQAIIDPGTGPTANFSFTRNLSTFNFQDASTNATSWSWDFGDGNTDSNQNPQHTYTASGSYTVTLTVSNGSCEETSIQTVDVTHVTAIDELLAPGSLKLYPNPGQGQFTIEAEAHTAQPMQLTVYNTLGQQLVSKAFARTTYFKEEVDLQEVPNGTYLIRLQVGGEVVMKKYLLTQ